MLLLAIYPAAPACEVERQIKLLDSGAPVQQETRGFDENRVETFALRSKEDAPEYRYMPDPNLPPLILTEVSVTFQHEVSTGHDS